MCQIPNKNSVQLLFVFYGVNHHVLDEKGFPLTEYVIILQAVPQSTFRTRGSSEPCVDLWGSRLHAVSCYWPL